MSPKDLKAKSRRAFEAINQRNLAVLDELWTPDVIVHTNSTTILGLEAYKQSLSALFIAFPDLRLTMEDQIVEGNKSVARFTSRGTHLGDIMDIPATGKQMHIPEISIFRDVDGKTVEVWIIGDSLTMMHQLGVIPTLGKLVSSLFPSGKRGTWWRTAVEFFLVTRNELIGSRLLWRIFPTRLLHKAGKGQVRDS